MMITRLLLIWSFFPFAARDIAAAPSKGLTLIDSFCAKAMEGAAELRPAASTLPRLFISVLKRYAASPHEQLVILIADSYKMSDDPYAPAAWWSPTGTLAILRQSTSVPDRVIQVLSLPGNPWEGCLANVEIATPDEVVVSCELGRNQPAKKVRVSIDKSESKASVTNFDPAPAGYLK